MNYSEKLKDPRWQKKRLEILERDKWACAVCGEKEKTLHVHHLFYFPKKEPWEIENGFLLTLCKDCHQSDGCSGKICKDCESFGNDCEGAGDTNEQLLRPIALILDMIWRDNGYFGGPDCISKLNNVYYILK